MQQPNMTMMSPYSQVYDRKEEGGKNDGVYEKGSPPHFLSSTSGADGPTWASSSLSSSSSSSSISCHSYSPPHGNMMEWSDGWVNSTSNGPSHQMGKRVVPPPPPPASRHAWAMQRSHQPLRPALGLMHPLHYCHEVASIFGEIASYLHGVGQLQHHKTLAIM